MEDSSVLASRRSDAVSSSVRRRTEQSGPNQSSSVSNELKNSFLVLSGMLLSLRSINIYPEPRPLYWLDTIGEGLSFVVKKGEEPDCAGREVVYKISRLRFSKSNEVVHPGDKMLDARRLKDLAMELHILTHEPLRNHQNIVKLLGFNWFVNPLNGLNLSPALEFEFAELGTLSQFQDSCRNLEFMVKLNLCHDVAKGLTMLHECGIYSFGLLGWKVMVDGRDPFSWFDLPRQEDIRYSRIKEILSVCIPYLADTVTGIVGTVCGNESPEMNDSLILFFAWTLAQNPEERNFPGVLRILGMLCNQSDSMYQTLTFFLFAAANMPG